MTGAELKEWRLRLGLTQAQAGQALGRSRVWVWSMERCPDKEIEERMVALACARVEVRYLLGKGVKKWKLIKA